MKNIYYSLKNKTSDFLNGAMDNKEYIERWIFIIILASVALFFIDSMAHIVLSFMATHYVIDIIVGVLIYGYITRREKY